MVGAGQSNKLSGMCPNNSDVREGQQHGKVKYNSDRQVDHLACLQW